MTDLSFSVESRFRPFALVAPGFVAAEAVSADSFTVGDASPPAPFAAVELDVVDPGTATVVAGLATPSGDGVYAVYDAARRRAAIEVRRDGRSRLVRRRRLHLPRGSRLGFAVCENRVTLLAGTGEVDEDGIAWRPVLTERKRVAARLDLRRPEVLAGLRYAWGARGGTGTARLGAARAGSFGMTGLRDPHLVQHADGRPYLRDGKAYLTFTCAGLGFFQQAHWGVFALDLADPTRLEQTAQLYSHRDGLLLGDHAGQLVRDDEAGRWIVATSAWGDFTPGHMHVRHTTTTEDLLHGVHLLRTERTALPTSVPSWDPSMTRIDGRWHVAFVRSPSQNPFDFHPALARGPAGAGAIDEDLELVGAATDLHQCEGPVLSEVDGTWWLLASDGERRVFPAYDLAMQRKGRLDAPYPTNIPHPQIVPLPEGGHLLVTFDGTQYAERLMGYGGHGDVVVMRSS